MAVGVAAFSSSCCRAKLPRAWTRTSSLGLGCLPAFPGWLFRTLRLHISFQRTRASSKIALSKPSSSSSGGPSIAICILASKTVVLIRFDNFVMTRAMTEKPRSQSTELRNSTRQIATRMAISL